MSGLNTDSIPMPEENFKQFSNILENIDDALFQLDPHFRFTYVNRAAARLARMLPERMLGQQIWDVWPFVRNSSVIEQYQHALKTGRAHHFHHKATKSGRHYEISVYPSPHGAAVLASDKTEKIRGEQQQREIQERFQHALEAASMVSWEWDVEENRMEFSGDFSHFFGVEELLRGEDVLRLVYRPDLHEHLQTIKRAVRDGASYHSTFRILRPDNRQLAWVEEWGTAVTGENGKTRRLIGVVKDITERKQTEDALRLSEERFRLASRAVAGVLYDWSLDREELYQSEGLERVTGYRIDEEPGTSKNWWPENIHLDDYPRIKAELDAAIDSGTDFFSYEYRIRHKDGHWVDILDQGYIVRDGKGVARRVVGTCMDISEQKQAALALRESERVRLEMNERFRTSVESLLDGFAILSAVREPGEDGLPGKIIDFRYDYINETGCRMNNRTYEEQVGHSLLELLPGHRESGLFERYVNLVETGEPIEVEDEEYEDVFGGERHLRRAFELRGVRLNDGFILTWRDVSQRKLAEQEIRSYAEKLERSNRELEEFAFVASHDLQEPLRKIRMFGDSLRKKFGPLLNEDAQESLDRMQGAAQRMQSMINSLLELSRVSTRGGSFEMTDLGRVLEDVLSDLEARLQTSRGQVEYGDLPSIQVDELQTRRLLQNLIGNALKFHQPGKPPRVSISSKPSKLGKVPAVCIRVQDNGIGFEMQYAERIFQPFQRLHGRSEYEGTGMGLSICQRIVERHHGKIEVHSQPGEGSCFLVTLPVTQANTK